MGPFRARLRAETRAGHARVDAAFAGFDLRKPQGYGDFLQAQAAVLPALEAAVAAHAAAWLPDWEARRRTPALTQDLAKLGRSAPAAAEIRAAGPQASLGALYVLEGSRLGARLLLAEVRAGPDPAVREATAYLAHGEGRRLWPSFLEVLEREGEDPEAATAGALAAFALFEAAARRGGS